ncbi:branched-chain amino acid transport system permease protein [Desulfocicer vacuolatum DSM 3385]|uniref:Branched-chain amino acid transport system permease protein n=1 Tax=Desulfocicer vacuolatum DSM 3385 TaxID=1121400 RepID=A0A1W2A315_9BACT|nr:branched-chain amino acid ABC transporter permease [Desulfocicer vacuolatum]SMC54831.1 branched-chain amino acid transport system permease protein [Desulfocicer vacuolatum DSM 3385]
MTAKDEIKKSFLASIWFMFLTFPLMVIKVNTVTDTVEWRWHNMVLVGIGAFFLSMLWRYLLKRQADGSKKEKKEGPGIIQRLLQKKELTLPGIIIIGCFTLLFPHIFSMYQTNIMISALIYVMLGLGLNIVIGLAGLLDLGYVAFFAVGAYSYALLNLHYGVVFWIALPLGGLLAALFGIILGYPVLRLRGDYLAIVTLGFGEIIRLVLENWNEFSFGPSGIANIPKPGLPGTDLSLQGSTIFIFYIIVALVIFTIFVINRLENSRIGRAWIALKDDEIACQSMGINKAKTKLRAFALGATWAGMGGVVFAAKTTFINPASFTIWESVIILCTVVLGGMGSIAGVISGALLLILLPEYLRDFGQFRMITFGAVLVLMMVFRPGGMIENVRKTYKFEKN